MMGCDSSFILVILMITTFSYINNFKALSNLHAFFFTFQIALYKVSLKTVNFSIIFVYIFYSITYIDVV